MFSCELSKNFRSSFSTEHPQIAVFVFIKDFIDIILIFTSSNVIHDYWGRVCMMKTKIILRRNLIYSQNRLRTGSRLQD